MKCNKTNIQTYNMLKEDETTWYCTSCSKDVFPFSDLNDNEFRKTTQDKKIKFLTIAKKRINNEHRLNKISNFTRPFQGLPYWKDRRGSPPTSKICSFPPI